MNLIAFDQSTTATGWCVMETNNSKIVAYGVIRPLGPTNERIREIIKKCMVLCKKFDVAFVFIEGIQVQRNPVVYEVLAKLKGTLEICLEEKGYIVNVVKATEWRKRVGIKNKKRDLVKQEALDMVKGIYKIEPSEDECEAILFARAFSAKETEE
ncbi:hypothetical protein A5819_003454 [Enterococcus sp. 7E2_DIV0204]|uniref:crossover junction endodeoxyribonuclease RuvC n=1 Tax=unclassified Enterococcus TaxID=2608891 RepID=UPI000A338685|nr:MULTISPECIES: crossover junction endodeoxyribonuclease RuvC [unclassified Enterococcus]OTN83717.1 hypothetical protein A5819_003814 [Enterococcus sp. 7E2_DIV0204]OTN86276.1 hypothetical protein A5819_003110 [Enterococcus sp. 7E2_DIV0204]OTN86604.1 hypothetical protein A5819_003454 [Enterococcus sp. 7E2_DIV0204]OTP47607.1 hypothetical protein A5884_003362 [Enterococcus sp. 7D2_DIV0200]OTP48531.1 hypothetical protein A5884_003194 [Enterococcus sp. 7D2_DIV0200]